MLLDEIEQINGWTTTFTRDIEKWFAIIISEKFQGKGIGTKTLNNLKDDEKTLNGWGIDHNSDKKSNGKYVTIYNNKSRQMIWKVVLLLCIA